MTQFVEQLHKDINYSFTGKKIDVGLVGDRTPYQHLMLYDSPVLGKVLILDSKVQFTELDEMRYHETMAHWPVNVVGYPRCGLVVGGGDLGVARELMKYSCIDHIDVVDIDGEVTRVVRDFVPSIAGTAMTDHRVRLGHQDAAKYVKQVHDGKYDFIIRDMTDATDVALSIYTREFDQDLYRVLADGGVMIGNLGSVDLQRKEVREGAKRVSDIFGRERTTILLLGLTCYQGGYYALVAGRKTSGMPGWMPFQRQSKVETKWYDFDLHDRLNFGNTQFVKREIFGE